MGDLLFDAARLYRKALPDEETRALVLAAQQGDLRARNRIVKENVRFVMSVVRRYRFRASLLDDVVQVGCVGLNHAIDKYDFRQGVKFLSFAVHWIRAAIQKIVFREASLITGLDTTQGRRYLLCNIGALLHQLESDGCEITPASLAEAATKKLVVRVKESDALAVLTLYHGELSVDAPVRGADNEKGTHVERMADSSPLADEQLDALQSQGEAEALVAVGLRALDPRERDIFRARFLADEDDGRAETLEKVGERYGFSRERARQLETRGMEKFKRAVEDARGGKMEREPRLCIVCDKPMRADNKTNSHSSCKRTDAPPSPAVAEVVFVHHTTKDPLVKMKRRYAREAAKLQAKADELEARMSQLHQQAGRYREAAAKLRALVEE